MSKNKEIVNTYVKALQSRNARAFASVLSEKGSFGSARMSAGSYAKVAVSAGWTDIKVITSFVGENGAALLYEGTDPKSGQRMLASDKPAFLFV